MIGMTLVTPQTGPEGRVVRKLLVEEIVPVRKAYYAGIVIDRERETAVIMASTAGGVEIEKSALESPLLIHRNTSIPRSDSRISRPAAWPSNWASPANSGIRPSP